jgi:hypothetical protein
MAIFSAVIAIISALIVLIELILRRRFSASTMLLGGGTLSGICNCADYR